MNIKDKYKIGDKIFITQKGGGLFQIRSIKKEGLYTIRLFNSDYIWKNNTTSFELKETKTMTDKEHFLTWNSIDYYRNHNKIHIVKNKKQIEIIKKLYD